MQLVAMTALGIGGATVIGALIGFIFQKIPHKWNDAIMGFAAGVMLAAAIIGLILPAAEMVGKSGIWVVGLGLLTGAVFLNLMDKVTPHLHHISGVDEEEHKNNHDLNKVLLFVMAIGIHNLPEGLAAGMAFGGGDVGNALSVAVGIAIQNIPEGMIIISPMLLAGIKKRRTFLIALATGLVEVIGTFLGFFAVNLAESILPFALAFAGGTMLYVVGDEMIPETHSHGYERMATYSLIIGFFIMLMMNNILA
ncbi:MAG: ZIP family metal transporter [Lachnospiraceae bacterium]|nr:ZIP family metal transporter [Lachnospiraceae bacterium]MBP3507290.1 ZIP family metal transporter [Lachnospiraceae bacterium]